VHITQSKGHARKLAYRAAQRGADLIAAVGGDGTLNEVVDGVMHAGVLGADGLPRAVITVLPLGSASDFHRTMAWEPDNFEEAMWRIGKRGSTAVLDVARVQCEGPDGPVDRHFINVASCGASAKAALAVDKWKWMGKKGKYRMAALAALMKHAPRTLGIRVDNGEWQKVSGATMVAIGNGSYFGHGLNITPDASPYSGTLQVVTARRMGVVDFILKSWRLKMGKHLDLKGFSAQEGSKIEVAPWKARRTEPEMPSFVAGAGGDLAAGAISREASMASMTSMTPRQPSEDSATGFAAAGPSAGPSRTASMSETEGAASQWSGSEGSLRKGRGFFPRRRSSGSLAGSEAKGKDGGKGKDGKEAAIDYGPVPLELDGEVVGWAPFAVTVLPGAIKFRV